MTCTVTLRVVDSAGDPVAGATVRFVPSPRRLESRGADVWLSTAALGTTAADGTVTLDLQPGRYHVQAASGLLDVPARVVDVPDLPSADLSDLLSVADPYTPPAFAASLAQVQDARDEAAASATSAAGSATAAAGSATAAASSAAT